MRSLACGYGAFGRSEWSSVLEFLGRQAEYDFLVDGSVVLFFGAEDGFGVDVVTVLWNFKVLVDPAAVLLDHMAIEFMGCEAQAFPPGVGYGTPPRSNSSHSYPAKVLVELGFIDFPDTVSADRDESPGNLMSVVEKQAAGNPHAEWSEEGVSLDIALQEIIEIPGHGEPWWDVSYLTPRSTKWVLWSTICFPLPFSMAIFMNFLKTGLSPWFQYFS